MTILTRLFCSTSAPQAVECVVIGAGVIGLACARALTLAGKEVLVLEAANQWGTQTSARHSEVIHAGLYYPPGSLKATLCVQGKHMLYDYLGQRDIPHRRVTKLVVATAESQIPKLKAIQACASANGVNDLVWLSGSQAKLLEPQLHAVAALLSPSTGILDSHTYMASLLADAESAGASLAVATRVVAGKVQPASQASIHVSMPDTVTGADSGRYNTSGTAQLSSRMLLHVQDTRTSEEMQLSAKMVVNAAGLQAQGVSRCIQGIPPTSIPKQYLARGVYFTLNSTIQPPQLTSNNQEVERGVECQGSSRDEPSSSTSDMEVVSNVSELPGTQPFSPTRSRPFSRLIYPLPQDGGLGIHLTLDMGGQARFGPDVEWISIVDYTVDPRRAASFESAIRTFWPGLPAGSLQPGYAGIRPKLSGPGQPAVDFVIQTVHDSYGHGVDGLVCLYGIESPGLTSSLAIAEYVKNALLSSQR